MEGFTDPKKAKQSTDGIVQMSREEFESFKDYHDPHQPVYEGLSGDHLGGLVHTYGGVFRPTSTRRLRDALEDLKGTLTQYHPAMRPFMRGLINRLQDIVGDVKVYGATDKAFDNLRQSDAAGFYQQQYNHMVIRDGMRSDEYIHTIIHEAVHAATIHSLSADKGFAQFAQKLMDHAFEQIRRNTGMSAQELRNEYYGFKGSDPTEFLAEAMSDPRFQDELKNTLISKDLADELQIPKFRLGSVWKALVDKLRITFGLPEKSTSALEAAMAVTEYSAWAKAPFAAEQFSGRMHAHGLLGVQRLENSSDPAVAKAANIKALTLDSPKYMARQVDNVESNQKKLRDRKLLSEATDVGTNASKLATKIMTKLWGNAALYDWGGRDFQEGKTNTFRSLIDAVERRAGLYREMREADATLGDRITALYKAFQGTEHGMTFDRLLERSSRLGVHPDDPLGEGRNARFKIGPNTKIWDEGSENFQGRAGYAEVAAMYKSLPPELQKLYRDLRDFYETKAEMISNQNINDILRSYDPPEGSNHEDVISRYQNGMQTEADDAHYEEAGLTKDIRDAISFTKERGPYFPVYREGNFVAHGRYKLEDGGFEADVNGEKMSQNVREFDTRRQAQEYMAYKNEGLNARMTQMNFMKDKDTGGVFKQVSSKEASTDPQAQYKQRFRVEVENKRVEIKDTAAEAARIIKEMANEGMEHVSQVLDRSTLEGPAKMLGSHVAAVMKRVDARDDLSAGAKKAIKDALTETMLASMTGNKLAKHFMKRYNVQGGEWANPKAYDAYSNAAASWMAGAKTRPTIDSSLKGMSERADAMEGSPNAYRMSALVNEMDRRTSMMDRASMDPKLPRWMNFVMKWNFMRYLASPAHILMHMVHVPTFVAPYLGSKYGYGTGYRALAAAYRDIGGGWPAMSQSFTSAGKLAMAKYQKDLQKQLDWDRGANYLETITKGITNPAERRMFKELAADNHIHANTGMEEVAGREVGVDRIERMMREITGAPDTINRSVTALAAFRLEMGKSGGDVEKSILAAKQALEFTQGQMSQTNMAPWMKAPWVRPFMQFRQFPMQISYMLGKTVYNILKNEEPGDRAEGLRFAAGLLGTVALMTGVNGMPTEMIKIPILLGAALGVTKMPSDYNEETREKLASWFGSGVSNVIMDGAPAMMGPVAPYIPHRAGVSSLWTFGEPDTNKPEDLQNFAMHTVFGATGSSIIDGMDGIRAVEAGDWVKAGDKLAPFSWGSHVVKAWQLAEEGKPTGKGRPGLPAQGMLAGLPELFGFTSQVRARYQTAQSAEYRETQEENDDRSSALRDIATADNEGDRFKALNQWNTAHPDNPIKGSDIVKEMRSRIAEEAFGFMTTKKNRETQERLKEAYGF